MHHKLIAGLGLGLGALLLLAGMGWVLNAEAPASGTVVAESGLHWHARLSVIENGVPVTIPADVGLGATHNPIHTHDDEPGLIHMEFSGRVTQDDLRLKNFFKVWQRTLPDTATMMVNGAENIALGAYIMQDGDEIVVTY